MAARAPALPKKKNVEESEKQLLAGNPNEEQIRIRAYEIYLDSGSQDGMAVQHWLQAEAIPPRNRVNRADFIEIVSCKKKLILKIPFSSRVATADHLGLKAHSTLTTIVFGSFNAET